VYERLRGAIMCIRATQAIGWCCSAEGNDESQAKEFGRDIWLDWSSIFSLIPRHQLLILAFLCFAVHCHTVLHCHTRPHPYYQVTVTVGQTIPN